MTGSVSGQLVPAPLGPLQVPAAVTEPGALRLSIVIPTYNEARNVEPLVRELEQLLEPRLGAGFELIVVDDDSPDRTWQVALELSAHHPRLRVVRRRDERGLATAVVRGWQVARGEVLGVMDGDLQHPSEVNLELLSAIERGAELAVASRHAPGGGVSDWRLRRRVLSRGAQLLGLSLVPRVFARLSDPLSGYFMLRRSLLAGVTLDPVGYKILVEVIARARPREICEVGYVFRERNEEQSKVSGRVYLDFVRQLARLRAK